MAVPVGRDKFIDGCGDPTRDMTPISRVNRNVVVRVRLGQEMLNIHGLGWVGYGRFGSAQEAIKCHESGRLSNSCGWGRVRSTHLNFFAGPIGSAGPTRRYVTREV